MSMFFFINIVVVTYSIIITVRMREPNIFWWFVFCSGIEWRLPSAYLYVQNSYSMFPSSTVRRPKVVKTEMEPPKPMTFEDASSKINDG